MKNIIRMLFLVILLPSCVNLNDIQPLKQINTIHSQKDEMTKIASNDNHIYYISRNTMSWNEAYNFCKRNGLRMADYMRTVYNDNMTAILEEKPICNLDKMPGYEPHAKQFINKQKVCKVFNSLTTNDTKVWIYPAIAGRSAIIINLKNGSMSTDIIAPDKFGIEQYTPYRALCEEK